MKKVLSITLAIIMVLSLCACGNTEQKPASEQGKEQAQEQNQAEVQEVAELPTTVEEKTIILESMPEPELTEVFTPNANEYKELSAASQAYKYVFYEKDNEGHIQLSAVPEADLIGYYNEHTTEGEYLQAIGGKKEENAWETALKKAILLVENLTKENTYIDREQGELYYTTYNGTGYNSAFGNLIFSQDIDVFELFHQEKFDLDISNAEIKKIIASEDLLQTAWTTVAVVDANVTCKSNDGIFKDIEWVPSVGESKDIEFIVCFESFTHDDWHNIIVQDIAVVE